MVRAGRNTAGKLGRSRYHEIFYEALVSKPEESLQGLCDFLALPYSPDMVSYYVGRVRHELSLSAKKAWLPPTSSLRDWRSDRQDRDIELFEALAGDVLTELGYERLTRETTPQIAALSAEYRQAWADEMGHSKQGRRQFER